MKYEKIIVFIAFLIVVSLLVGAFTPQDNINLRDYYNITNISWFHSGSDNISFLSGQLNVTGDVCDVDSGICLGEITGGSTDDQTLSINSTNINDTITIEDGNTITINDNFEADTTIGNCSGDGDCSAVFYDSEYNVTGLIRNWSYVDTDTNNYVDGASFSGTDTKTLTLTRSGLSDITADFTDRFEQDTVWVISNDYIINDSGTLSLDETKLNSTIDARDDYEPDTNETTRVDTIVGTDCGSGNYTYGFDSNGNIQCREDQTGAGSDTDLTTTGNFNSSELENQSNGNIGIIDSFINTLINNKVTQSFIKALGFYDDTEVYNKTEANNTMDARDDFESDTNETTRFENLVGTSCASGDFVYNISDDGTIQCNTPSGSGDITGVFTDLTPYLLNGSASGEVDLNFNESYLNNTIDSRGGGTDDQTLSVNSTNINDSITIENGNTITINDNYEEDTTIPDTNETTRVSTIVGTDCGAGNYSYGFDSSGNIVCREDIDTDTNDYNTSSEMETAANQSGFIINWSGVGDTNTNIIDDNEYNTSELEEQTDGKLGVIDSFINTLIENKVTQSFVNTLFPNNDLTTDKDTNASTECTGDTYLSGDGTCETDDYEADTNTQLDDEVPTSNVDMNSKNITNVDCIKGSGGSEWCFA